MYFTAAFSLLFLSQELLVILSLFIAINHSQLKIEIMTIMGVPTVPACITAPGGTGGAIDPT